MATDSLAPAVIDKDDPLQRFVAVEEERRKLEAQVAALEKEATALAARILEDWADRGQRNATVGKLLVFTRSEMYCSKRPGVDGKTLADVLVSIGLGQAVGYNAASLKSYVKEKMAQAAGGETNDDELPEGVKPEDVLPPELAALITVGENVRLRTRSAK
jgi:hypothetical protein